MDRTNPNRESRSAPQYGLYQRENCWKSSEGVTPPFNTDPAKLEELAKQRLTANGWFYASSNAGQSYYTHTANRQSFYRHRIIPRMAGNSQWRKVAGELGLPYCLSTAGSNSIEDVAAANNEGAKVDDNGRQEEKGALRFFQLYMLHDDKLTFSFLTRAYNTGFKACILTLDTWKLGWRNEDVATSNYAFYPGTGADLGLSDPVFQNRLKEQGIDPKKQPNEAGALWIYNVRHGRAHTWEKIKWAMDVWKNISGGLPFCVKGIQSVNDAKKAVEIGCDGIVVSNHAGRQVDGATVSLDALEQIVDAVGDETYIMFDSGVRGASDVFKALALGAKFIFSLLADLDILLNVAGYWNRNIPDIDRSAIDSLPKAYQLLPQTSKL
ncbi:FMN-linked oxidoreductase [Delitschia confertaspora ATCC 74209]|uniref:FMN-linked oxidoreductase n=1 Tax=Delitschia confertaspora ATCC 74209 TaxID=1513339 RepID=A0A9P4MPX8_9PLEO|nr:FMN-linked oxidoreductase [Delitschia confertaspora ATCC 74209]